MKEVYVILHNVRSEENVGSILRSADGAGATGVFLCGYTPTPIDRFGRSVPKIKKTALGAEKFISWEKREDTVSLLRELKKKRISIVAVEQDARAVHYRQMPKSDTIAFVFGSEVDGLPEEILVKSDYIVEIPMKGKKESLNVAVSVGVILFNN